MLSPGIVYSQPRISLRCRSAFKENVFYVFLTQVMLAGKYCFYKSDLVDDGVLYKISKYK